MSRFGSLSAALRLLLGGRSNSSKEFLKVKILNQFLNDGKIDLELDSKESFLEIKPTRDGSKVPLKDLEVMKIHLNKSDADLLAKAKQSHGALGLGLINKDQIERMSTTVIIFTMAQFGYKIITGVRDLINDPKSFMDDVLYGSLHEREMRECLVKISNNIRRIEEHLAVQKVEGKDGGGNAVTEGKDGSNDGAAAAKEGNDNVEVRGENAAANLSTGMEEDGNAAANPSGERKEEDSGERKEEGSAGREEEGSSESDD